MSTKMLTDRFVANVDPPTGTTDSGNPRKSRTIHDEKVRGLMLRISRGGTKTWAVRYRMHGRHRRYRIGTYPAVPLAEARRQALIVAGKVAQGRDPVQEEREERIEGTRRQTETVKAVAALYLDLHALGPDVGPRDKETGRIEDPWTFEPETGTPRKRTWKEDRRKLEVEVLPKWGSRPLTEISRRDVRDLVEAIANRGAPIQANRVRGLLSKMWNFAIERELADVNPVLATSKPGEETPRDRVLTDDEIRKLWEETGKMKAQMGALFRLLLLTGQRLGELRNMEWAELDLEARVWTIPATRSKNRKSHRVPLSDAVLEIVTGLPQHEDYVLAGCRGNRQTYTAAAEIGLPDFQPGRDLRTTAATRMATVGVPRLHVGLVLNHTLSDVTSRHYDRATYDDEKRVALDALARTIKAVLDRERGNVVPISAKGA